MSEVSYVVVFPTIFSKNRIPHLISNIKKILKIKNQQFTSVKRDGSVILVHANDPVFASTAINLLFGIEKIAIARQVNNNFQEIVSEVTSIGGNLLLKGERFLVKIEGTSKGFVTKDVEMAATSNIIEKKSGLGAQPGTEEKFDKIIYSYLTKNHAYICIFVDEGKGGIPSKLDEQQTICAVYDEISAICCYETIKQGYNVKIIVCYRQKSELTDIVKTINQIIPRTLQENVELEFIHMKIGQKRIKNHLIYVSTIIEILTRYSAERISLALSPLIFSMDFIDDLMRRVFEKKKIPILPLSGIDMNMFEDGKEIGLERNFKKMKKNITLALKEVPTFSKKNVDEAVIEKTTIIIKIGPNNVHDILDSLENH